MSLPGASPRPAASEPAVVVVQGSRETPAWPGAGSFQPDLLPRRLSNPSPPLMGTCFRVPADAYCVYVIFCAGM